MKKSIHIITTLVFLAVLCGVLFLNLIRPAEEFSVSERRKLAQFPELSLKTVMDGSFMEGFDNYATDQAVGRENFRRLKANFDFNVMRKLDNNNIFVRDGIVFKTDYPLNESSVLRLCGILTAVHARYLTGMENVYFTVVPEKNAYLENSGHLIIDYAQMTSFIKSSLPDRIEYIDLFPHLSLDSYYRTDSHWRQEGIRPVANAIADAMGVTLGQGPYSEESFDRFYGVYYGQSALPLDPDELIWLVSETTEKAIVNSTDKPGQAIPVYDLTQLESPDPYNIFMCGPSAVVTAKNPLNKSGRELVIFRDSYASSLSPLLLEGYSTVTLIDLRYIYPDHIGQFVTFTNQDVLFMYSTGLFNGSESIRGPLS